MSKFKWSNETIACMKQFKANNRLSYALSIATKVIEASLNILLAFLMMTTVEAMELSEWGLIYRAFAMLGVFLLGSLFLGLIQKRVINRYLKTALSQFKNYVFGKILAKSINEFQGTASGRFISAFSNDMSQIETNYLSGNIQIVHQIVLGGFAMIAMGYLNLVMLACVAAALILPTIIASALGKRLTEREKNTSDANETFVGQLKDLLNGFIVIKSFKAENAVLGLFRRQNISLEESKQGRRETNDVLKLTGSMSTYMVISVIFTSGAYMAFNNLMTIGAVIAYVQLSNFILEPVRALVPLFSNRKAAVSLIDKMGAALRNDGGDAPKRTHAAKFENMIKIEELSFSYSGGPDDGEALTGVNLTFEKDKSYAIVGNSGSGKSTLLNLLMGHFCDFKGRVALDGRDLLDINLDSLYDVVSVIQQNVFLFDDSVKNNITLFKEFPEEKLNNAVMLAGLSGLVEEKGWGYKCGENGSNLSGGEKQRVSIARCLLRETPILLVDEATAALDNKTAYEVTNAILALEGITKIVVTHKIESALMRRFDEIIVLKNGRVVEKGSFDEIMGRKSYFYSLYNVSEGAA
jgi:ABC-type multidrug transport system fused ATPase/permease subunit